MTGYHPRYIAPSKSDLKSGSERLIINA